MKNRTPVRMSFQISSTRGWSLGILRPARRAGPQLPSSSRVKSFLLHTAGAGFLPRPALTFGTPISLRGRQSGHPS